MGGTAVVEFVVCRARGSAVLEFCDPVVCPVQSGHGRHYRHTVAAQERGGGGKTSFCCFRFVVLSFFFSRILIIIVYISRKA